MSVKITQFEAENVKRIKAAVITPSPNGLTIIGGGNCQGKTSALDAIAWALGGDRFRPSQAQRDGSVLPPRLKAVLSDGTVVERKGKNSALTVTDPTGKKAGQQLLNSLISDLALDMPKFMSASGREKADILLQTIGLKEQVSDLERKETDVYNRRRSIGQIADQKNKHAKELPEYPDAPEEPVSAFELISKQQDILARNGENQRKRLRVREIEREAAELEEKVADMKFKLAAANEALAKLLGDLDTARKDAMDLQDEATDELEANIRDIDALNVKVRTNQEKARALAEAKEYGDQYTAMTTELEGIRRQKRELLEGAALPLPGLSVENGELTYLGKPWDCMSGSDQLKVSAAIVRAVKPSCGFVLLDKLEQMDANTLREFGAWMEAEGLQGIATRVSTGGECSIIIEDGCVVAPPADAPGPPSWQSGAF